ncbi:2-C-methyl-D-erythritol 4-phosphate cytidylyltransferase [uncultured Schumannella sp.]|uniref:2-C-methyl-D-erythritol 4-phosphate cytidylyltransferase n=1 Tax=uncultured Schumannella sp. TaxID=1195956 RepID=UPI0025D82459|nr:2-C-methyl-D-erythritol 4-phosphate cytidylyltransferase [uncultured Schumannella sp.]
MTSGAPSPFGVVIVAAGSGTRLGHPVPKAFVTLGARTLLERAIDGVLAAAEEFQIVIVVPADRLEEATRIAERAGPGTQVVVGGATRQGSVAAGLAALPGSVDIALVHDAARALTPSAVIDRVARAVRDRGVGVVPGLRVVDTLKRVAAAPQHHPLDAEQIVQAVDRAELVTAQTPQGFPRVALQAAYDAASTEHTDDAALFAAAGGTVVAVDGDALGFKITTPADLERAEHLVGGTERMRTGIGIDVHAYDESAPLWLGGLYWPDEPGLAGHSDGDAVIHAICDALLSAAGLGDIGSRFGTADPRFADARSEVFLSETLALVSGAGYRIQNVAVQVVAQRPRLAGRRLDMEAHLSTLVGAPVSVAATTSDGLGFTGRGEGVQAVATALILG